MSKKILVRGESAPRTYFTQVPNIAMNMGLSPHTFTLYVHLCMIAGYGRGVCYKGIRALARDCNMSKTSVTKAKKELESLDLIEISTYPDDITYSHIITVKDQIWWDNIEFFETRGPNLAHKNI